MQTMSPENFPLASPTNQFTLLLLNTFRNQLFPIEKQLLLYRLTYPLNSLATDSVLEDIYKGSRGRGCIGPALHPRRLCVLEEVCAVLNSPSTHALFAGPAPRSNRPSIYITCG